MMTIMMNMKTQKSNTVAKRSAGGEEIFQVRQREYTGHAVAFFRKVGNLTQGELASQIPCSVNTDLPQSRMNMAGMLASIGIRQPAYDVHGDDPFGKELTGISSDPYGSHPAVYMRRERKAPTSSR